MERGFLTSSATKTKQNEVPNNTKQVNATPNMEEIAKRLMSMSGKITGSDIDSMTTPSSGNMVGHVTEPVCATGPANLGLNKSYASLLGSSVPCTMSKFRTLVNDEKHDAIDCVLPIAVAAKIKSRYENSIVGFFVGKDPSFPVVKQYVSNTWRKFGFERITRNDDGVYLFKFASKGGMEQVLEKGPWLIRNSPIILNKWSPNVSMTKGEVTKLPVWVKLFNVPILAYSVDGLSLIATQIGKPVMLDAFTSAMCDDSWGRISFARALIEIDAAVGLKKEVTMAIPIEDGEGYLKETIRVEYEWKPLHCVDCKCFGHDTKVCPNRAPEEIVHNSARDVRATDKQEPGDGFTEVKSRKKKKGAAPRAFVGLRMNNPKSTMIWEQKKGGNKKPSNGVNPDVPMDNPFEGLTVDHVSTEIGSGIIKEQNKGNVPSSSSGSVIDAGSKDKKVSTPPTVKKNWDHCLNASDTSEEEGGYLGGGQSLEDEDYGYDGYDGYEDLVVDLQGAKQEFRDFRLSMKSRKR